MLREHGKNCSCLQWVLVDRVESVQKVGEYQHYAALDFVGRSYATVHKKPDAVGGGLVRGDSDY